MTVALNKEIEFDGLDLSGGFYQIQSIEGLADMPGVRSADIVVAGRDGQRFGRDYLDTRTVTITLMVTAFDETDFADAMAALRAKFQPLRSSDAPLTFKFAGIADGEIVRLNCRPRRMAIPLGSSYWQSEAEVTVQFQAVDPVLYSEVLLSQSTTLPTAGGGLDFPLVFPLLFGSVSTGGSITANNAGNWPVDTLIRIDGPAALPRVENVTTGKVIALSLGIDTGDYVVIDTKNRTVLLNGTASRYSSLTDDSEWWQLEPGDNEISFRATTDTAANLTVAWRSGWL